MITEDLGPLEYMEISPNPDCFEGFERMPSKLELSLRDWGHLLGLKVKVGEYDSVELKAWPEAERADARRGFKDALGKFQGDKYTVSLEGKTLTVKVEGY